MSNPGNESTFERKNLLELYRQHRDEIDALTDPLSLFILGFTNHVGTIRLDELAYDVGVSRGVLRTKLTTLVRSRMMTENNDLVLVTAFGKRVLSEIGFPLPPIPPSDGSRLPDPPKQPSSRPPSAQASGLPSWLVGTIVFLITALVLLLGIAIGRYLIFPEPTSVPTSVPTQAPIIVPSVPSGISSVTPAPTSIPTLTPTSIPTPTPTPVLTSIPTPTWTETPNPQKPDLPGTTVTATSTSTPTASVTETTTKTFTPTPTFTSSLTPTRTRTPIPDTVGPPAPAIVSPKNNVALNCGQTVILDWNPSSDPSGIMNYSVALWRIDSIGFGSTIELPAGVWPAVTGTSINVSQSITCGHSYRWSVSARDNAGNIGVSSPSAHFSVLDPTRTPTRTRTRTPTVFQQP